MVLQSTMRPATIASKSPNVFIPWGIRETDLKSLLEDHGLRHITLGYYRCRACRWMAYLTNLDSIFIRGPVAFSTNLNSFVARMKTQKASFDEFQKHFDGITANIAMENFISTRVFQVTLNSIILRVLSEIKLGRCWLQLEDCTKEYFK